jgi:hypothetical protein
VEEEEYMRYHFDQVFQTQPDGSISPKTAVKFNGYTVLPTRRLPRGSLLGGIPIHCHFGEDIEVEKEKNGIIIMGFYPGTSVPEPSHD